MPHFKSTHFETEVFAMGVTVTSLRGFSYHMYEKQNDKKFSIIKYEYEKS